MTRWKVGRLVVVSLLTAVLGASSPRDSGAQDTLVGLVPGGRCESAYVFAPGGPAQIELVPSLGKREPLTATEVSDRAAKSACLAAA